MASGHHAKNMGTPDITNEFSHHTRDLVELGDVTVGRSVHRPGWRWSTHIRPTVGGEWCEVRHVGFVLAGRMDIRFKDGTILELKPDDVFDLPPGHDTYVVGDEDCVLLEWTGMRRWTGAARGASSARNRVLVALLFTDVVGSTATAVQLGDAAWDDLLASHYEAARAELERFGGSEVTTTGDGMLATFDAPAAALECAAAMCQSARGLGLHLRAGVHAGEVRLVGDDIRGVAVHEAARIGKQAGADEILVSETTRALALPSGLTFEDRGEHLLKGLEGKRRLFALVTDTPTR